MKYGLYLTIDGGRETIPVGLFKKKTDAVRAMEELSNDKERVEALAEGRFVTCLEVINRNNMTTEKYIPWI